MTLRPSTLALDKEITSYSDSVFSDLNGNTITRAELLSHAWTVSKQLPDNSRAINLCNNRYLFTVCYLAAIIRNQISLLPANHAENSIGDLLHRYQDSYYITDHDIKALGPHFNIDAEKLGPVCTRSLIIDPKQIVSISFTSGSTGVPKATSKTWREFQQSAKLAVSRFSLERKKWSIISTVPPQHMYGLETSLYWPLFSDLSIGNSHYLFPEDIRLATDKSTTPCLLISTPTHLKACVRADLNWGNVAMVLSSTAPMDLELAKQIETCFNAPLYEIFGSTETMSIASRRLTVDERWEPYRGISVFVKDNDYYVQGGHLQQVHKLDDHLSIDEQGYFTVSGRASDLVKIAGKRASLTELNRILNQIDGVEDGIFYLSGNERLKALVVSTIDKKTILAELRKSIDEVFLPRPLHIVKALPRNQVGKIIKENLDCLV